MKRIIQLTAAMHEGDATGNHALYLDKMFKRLRYKSIILSPTIDEPLKNVVLPLEEFEHIYEPVNDILWLHFNLPSRLTDLFIKAEGTKILQFHNITPADYFLPYNLDLAGILKKGRDELIKLKDNCTIALGDSEFNCSVLKELGFKNVFHFPLVFDENRYQITGEKPPLEKKKDKVKKIIFVGRVVPNKRIEDLIRCFNFYNKNIREISRLVIVGKYDPYDSYFRQLLKMMGILSADGVQFTGSVTHDELIYHYTTADLFLSFSEHEGFFMPMLESFHFGLPVLARKSTAVVETAGDSAMLFETGDVRTISEIIEELLVNDHLRRMLIDRGKKRIGFFSYENAQIRLKEIVDRL